MRPLAHISRLLRDTRGTSVVDFALSVPILVFLLTATVDIGRFALAHLKLYNAASALADLASRDETLSVARVNDLFAATAHIVEPFAFGPNGRVVLTGVSADVANDPRVFWQMAGGGTLSAASTVGAVGGPATLPPSLTIDPQETIIVAEVFYTYRPMFALPFGDSQVHQTAYFRPRLGSLRTLQ